MSELSELSTLELEPLSSPCDTCKAKKSNCNCRLVVTPSWPRTPPQPPTPNLGNVVIIISTPAVKFGALHRVL